MERATRQRDSIRSAVNAAGRPLLPAEVLELAQREVQSLGLATVYRNLKALLEAGEIKVVELPGEPVRYEPAGHDHHHHFRCDACTRVFDIPGCPPDIDHFVPAGFAVNRHELTLYGLCADCQPASGTRAPRAKAPPHRH